MKTILKYILALATLLLTQTFSFAQDVSASGKNPVDSLMLSNGKIFVVAAVVFIIMLGLFIYMFSLDKKMSKLETDMKD